MSALSAGGSLTPSPALCAPIIIYYFALANCPFGKAGRVRYFPLFVSGKSTANVPKTTRLPPYYIRGVSYCTHQLNYMGKGTPITYN